MYAITGQKVTTNTLYAKAQELANAGKIDPISNLSSRRAYVQAGASYEAVYQSAGETATSLFSRFGCNVLSKFDLDTGHGIPTLDYGQPCNSQGLLDCDYEGATELLKHLYGSLTANVAMKSENLIYFDQSENFSSDLDLNDKAVIYVPDGCKNSSGCKVHVQFHGCGANIDSAGDYYTKNSGFNEVAEANNIIVLYPQGSGRCFDGENYFNNGDQFATKEGEHIKRMWNMVKRISGQEVTVYSD